MINTIKNLRNQKSSPKQSQIMLNAGKTNSFKDIQISLLPQIVGKYIYLLHELEFGNQTFLFQRKSYLLIRYHNEIITVLLNL